eukprot:5296062-Amphidinium_carterae.1
MEGRAAARPSASLLVGVVAANLTCARQVQQGRMRRLCCRNQRVVSFWLRGVLRVSCHQSRE